jgi:enediyne biosynthesis protein E4
MSLTRRSFLQLLVSMTSAAPHRLLAQGVSQHTTKPMARPTASGRAFNAHFVDVAASAGLREPVVYGNVESKKYILEATGCGCAFIDYDNDGWLDIFLLSGTRLDSAPPEATNRLYKNNRDGTFTDVTEKAGLRSVGWASGVCVGDYNNDGFEDIFCTYFGQNKLYRNNGDGTFTEVTAQAGLSNDAPRWGAGCTFLDYNRDGYTICLFPTMSDFRSSTLPFLERTLTATGKEFLWNVARVGFPPASILSIATTATAHLPKSASKQGFHAARTPTV